MGFLWRKNAQSARKPTQHLMLNQNIVAVPALKKAAKSRSPILFLFFKHRFLDKCLDKLSDLLQTALPCQRKYTWLSKLAIE